MTADEFNAIYDTCLDYMEADDSALVVMVPGPNGLYMVQANLAEAEMRSAYSPSARVRGAVALRAVIAARGLVG